MAVTDEFVYDPFSPEVMSDLEGRVLLEEFLRRVADYEVDEAAAVRLPSSFQWGFNELPVVVKELA